MGKRLLLVAVVVVASSWAVAEDSAAYPLFPEGDEFYFKMDPSDPVYSDMFARQRYVTPMIPEDIKSEGGRYVTPMIPEDIKRFSGAKATTRDTCPAQEVAVMCGTHSISAGEFRTFTSPNYPLAYTSRFLCYWTFQAAGDGEELELTCSDFTLASGRDYLGIDSDGSDNVLYKGSNSPPTTTTSGGVLKAVFKTDRRRNAKGFKCTVTNTGNPSTSTENTPTTEGGNNLPLSHPKCGIHNLRIVNGVEATPNEYPWQVWVVTYWTDGRGASCGGSIINDQWVLTAAHCISKTDSDGSVVPVSSIRVTVGAHLKQDPGAHGGYNVQAEVPPSGHSSYNFPSHDIALLKLQSSLTFTKTVGPVCLPPRSWATDDFIGKNITLSGWGVTESGSSSTYLRHTHTTGYALASCTATYGSGVDNTVLCTDGSDVKKVCSGDSGGPVTVSEEGRRFIVGVVSFTGGCTSTRPDGHGRVAYFIDWIESTTGINFGI